MDEYELQALATSESVSIQRRGPYGERVDGRWWLLRTPDRMPALLPTGLFPYPSDHCEWAGPFCSLADVKRYLVGDRSVTAKDFGPRRAPIPSSVESA